MNILVDSLSTSNRLAIDHLRYLLREFSAVRQEAMGQLALLHHQDAMTLVPRLFDLVANHQHSGDTMT